MALINFTLKDPAEISRYGGEYISWFYLTDGDYWMSVGEETLYEHTAEVAEACGVKGSIYTDYYVVRFLEDFTGIFADLAESIPDNLHEIIRSSDSINEFRNKAGTCYELKDDDDSTADDILIDKYFTATEWIGARNLRASHLKEGPYINFFRKRDKVSIVWECDFKDENGVPVWTAGNGSLDMRFDDFIKEVESWGELFFASMDLQIEKAFKLDWGTTKIDKVRIREEHEERKRDFSGKLDILKASLANDTDWLLINALVEVVLAT
jgi:Family of unknown function (DUF5984)